LRKRYVLDAGVLALYFAGRRDARRFIDDAYAERAEAYMLEINLAEFLYNYARVFGWEAALTRHSMIRASPIRIVGVDEELTVQAAKLKLRHYSRLSLADCYLLALAKKLGATVVTTDHAVREAGEARVILLRL